MKENENNIVSDPILRDGNDDQVVEGVEVEEELEEAEIASKGTKNDLETSEVFNLCIFSLSFENTNIHCYIFDNL